jgi:hypothetical protein
MARSGEGCFAHKGIVQAAEAVVANLDKVGLLEYLLDSRPATLRIFLAKLSPEERERVRRSTCGLLDDEHGNPLQEWKLPTTTVRHIGITMGVSA